MTRFLLFLSSLLLICASGHCEEDAAASCSSGYVNRYEFGMDMGKAAISGIMISRVCGDEIRGCIVNEFGVSAVDFIYSKKKRKMKLTSVARFLDKWYIKRVLRADLGFCLHVLYDIPYDDMSGYWVDTEGDSVTVIETKRKFRYTFAPLEGLPETIDEDDTERQSV